MARIPTKTDKQRKRFDAIPDGILRYYVTLFVTQLNYSWDEAMDALEQKKKRRE